MMWRWAVNSSDFIALIIPATPMDAPSQAKASYQIDGVHDEPNGAGEKSQTDGGNRYSSGHVTKCCVRRTGTLKQECRHSDETNSEANDG